MDKKCPCLTDTQACCTCVSMHCDECHKPMQSKFVQGRFCSNCGRPLKAELQSEFEELKKQNEDLTINMNAYALGMISLKEQKDNLAREIFEELYKSVASKITMQIRPIFKDDLNFEDGFRNGKNDAFLEVLLLIAELKNKYIGEQK